MRVKTNGLPCSETDFFFSAFSFFFFSCFFFFSLLLTPKSRQYEAMPHVGPVILPDLEESRRNMRGWADFISAAVADPKKIESSFTTVKTKTLEEVPIDPARLTPFSEDDVRQMARDRVGHEPPVPETRVKL